MFDVIRRLVDKGRTWVKLSVTYDNTKDGPPGYADITKVARAYVKAAPERMVWGSNWPHPNEDHKPDDAMLFDLMSQMGAGRGDAQPHPGAESGGALRLRKKCNRE